MEMESWNGSLYHTVAKQNSGSNSGGSGSSYKQYYKAVLATWIVKNWLGNQPASVLKPICDSRCLDYTRVYYDVVTLFDIFFVSLYFPISNNNIEA